MDLYHNDSMYKGAKPDTFKKAELLREKMTLSEIKLWEVLKNKTTVGYRFRRQHPLGNYILDFYNHSLKLCIEVDGEYHQTKEQIEYDQKREEFLKFNGISTVRFTNFEVDNELEEVILKLKNFIENIKPYIL